MKSIANQNIFGEFHTETEFRFGESQVNPANPKALEYADAVCAMCHAPSSDEAGSHTKKCSKLYRSL